MLLSKYAAGNTPVTLNVANFSAASTAERWELSGDGRTMQAQPGSVNLIAGSISLSLPPESITLLILSPQQQQPPPPAPIASLSSPTMNFGLQLLNSYTVTSTVILTNSGNAALNISGLSLSGQGLVQVNNCPGSLSPGASCFISVKPTTIGPLTGTFTIADDAAGSPHSFSITGTGRDITLSTPRISRSRRLNSQGALSRRRLQ
jgi:hypothetical protein